jgi:hypothetical protein
MSTLTLPEISGASEVPSEAAMRHNHPDAPSNKKNSGPEQSSAGKARMEQAKAGVAVAEIEAALAGIGSASKTAAKLAEIQDMTDDVNRKLEKEEERQMTMDMELRKMDETLIKAKENRGGVYGIKTGTDAIQKQVKNLEKRLDKARSNYNLAVDENNQLKAEIDTTRHEIGAGQVMLDKEIKELSEKRANLRVLTDEAQAAYTSRDRAESEMRRLKQESEDAEKTFRRQWERLQDTMEEDRKATHERKRLKQKTKAEGMAEDKSAGAVKMLEKKLGEGKWKAGNALAQEQGAIEQTKNTQMALDQIFSATGYDNVEDLVAAMMATQDSIDSYFIHVSEVDDVNHQLAAEVAMMREADDAALGSAAEAEGHRRKMERNVEEQLARQDEKMRDCDAELEAASKIEQQIFPKVKKLHEILGLSQPLAEGEEPEVMDVKKMMMLLSPVEEELTKLLRKIGAQPEPPAPPPPVPDYARMVEKSQIPDMDEQEIAVAQAPPTGSQVPNWMQQSRGDVSIQPPSISGVDISSSEEEEEDDDEEEVNASAKKSWRKSPRGGDVLTRQQIKDIAEREKRRAERRAESAEPQ